MNSNRINNNIHSEGLNRPISIISSNVLFMLTTPGIPEFGYVAKIGLISLLSLKEILSASKYQGKALENSLNLGIVPLLISCTAMVVYKIIEIL